MTTTIETTGIMSHPSEGTILISAMKMAPKAREGNTSLQTAEHILAPEQVHGSKGNHTNMALCHSLKQKCPVRVTGVAIRGNPKILHKQQSHLASNVTGVANTGVGDILEELQVIA